MSKKPRTSRRISSKLRVFSFDCVVVVLPCIGSQTQTTLWPSRSTARTKAGSRAGLSACLAIRYRRERWVTPDGQTVIAPLPPGIDGHFGPNLRRFVLMLYHQGQSTLARVIALLRSIGVAISERQVQRLLTERHDAFLYEARDVLRAGLASAAWISVDDTGARHKLANAFCTQIGDDRFTYFATRATKSRLNFLDLLRAGHTDFVLNQNAFDLCASVGSPPP